MQKTPAKGRPYSKRPWLKKGWRIEKDQPKEVEEGICPYCEGTGKREKFVSFRKGYLGVGDIRVVYCRCEAGRALERKERNEVKIKEEDKEVFFDFYLRKELPRLRTKFKDQIVWDAKPCSQCKDGILGKEFCSCPRGRFREWQCKRWGLEKDGKMGIIMEKAFRKENFEVNKAQGVPEEFQKDGFYVVEPEATKLEDCEFVSCEFEPSLEELQELVGGLIELVRLKGADGVVDEEGKLKEKTINLLATKIYGQYNDYIVGPMVICCGKARLR